MQIPSFFILYRSPWIKNQIQIWSSFPLLYTWYYVLTNYGSESFVHTSDSVFPNILHPMWVRSVHVPISWPYPCTLSQLYDNEKSSLQFAASLTLLLLRFLVLFPPKSSSLEERISWPKMLLLRTSFHVTIRQKQEFKQVITEHPISK